MTRAVKERPIIFSGESVRAILDGRKTQTRRVVLPQPEGEPRSLDDWSRRIAETCGEYNRDPVRAAQHVERLRGVVFPFTVPHSNSLRSPVCKFGRPGDKLWVRETWNAEFIWPDEGGKSVKWYDEQPPAFRGLKSLERLYFAADVSIYALNESGGALTDGPIGDADNYPDRMRWRSSVLMPRWASRLTLAISDIRVERVQQITNEDAIAEGYAGVGPLSPRGEYACVWEGLNAKRGYSWESNPWVWIVTFEAVTLENAHA